MKIAQSLLIFVAIALATGCSNTGKPGDNSSDLKEERRREIEQKEQDLIKNADLEVAPNKAKANELINLYRGFAQANPKDSLSPDYLFKAADLSIGLGSYEQAIGLLNGIIDNFPDYERRVEIMYFKGFVFENHMDQLGKAREAYMAVVESYPNHRLAAEAQAAMANLALTDEELIEKFKAMNQETAEGK